MWNSFGKSININVSFADHRYQWQEVLYLLPCLMLQNCASKVQYQPIKELTVHNALMIITSLLEAAIMVM